MEIKDLFEFTVRSNLPIEGTTEPSPGISEGLLSAGTSVLFDRIPKKTDRDTVGGLVMPEPSTGFFSSIASGFTETGIVSGLSKATMSAISGDAPRNDLDPDLNPRAVIENDQRLTNLYTQMVNGADDPMTQVFLDELHSAPNAQVMLHLFQQYENAMLRREAAQKESLVGYGLGMLGGITVDVLAALALGNIVGGGTAATLHGARVARTGLAARGLGAARVGVIGATEGGLERSIQGITDKSVTTEEVLTAIGMGGLIGGVLGGALPRLLGNVYSAPAQAKAWNDMAAIAREQAKAANIKIADDSVGARKVQQEEQLARLDTLTATRGTGTTVPRIIPKWLRSARGRARDLLADAKKSSDQGFKGGTTLANVLGRVYKISTLVAEDLQNIARVPTIQTGLRAREESAVAINFAIKGVYDTWLKNAIGSRLGARMKDGLANEYVLSNTVGKLQKNAAIPYQEFRNVASLIAQAEADGTPEVVQEILDLYIKGRVPDSALGDTEAALRKMAKMEDDFYFKYGQEEADQGLISDEELRPGYRPQLWNTDEATAKRRELVSLILQRMQAEPDIDWLRTKAIDPEGNPLVTADDTWESFSNREPGLAAELADDWDEIKRDSRLEELQEVIKKREDALSKLGRQSAEEVLADHEKTLKNLSRRETRAHNEMQTVLKRSLTVGLGNPQVQQQIAKLNTRIAKIELERDAANKLVHELRYSLEIEDKLRAGTLDTKRTAFQRGGLGIIGQDVFNEAVRVGRTPGQIILEAERTAATRAQQDALKTKVRSLDRAQRRAEAAALRKTMRQQAEEIVDAIIGHKNPGGFLADEAIQTSRHFKRRSINLKGVRHKPEWQQFLHKDWEMNLDMYNSTVGRQLEIREKFMPAIRARGLAPENPEDIKDFKPIDAIKRIVREDFDTDLAALEKRKNSMTEKQFNKQKKALVKQQREGLELLDRVFGEVTRSDYMHILSDPGKVLADRMLNTAQSVTSTMALGFVVASSITDIAITAFAGGKTGTGFRALFERIFKQGIIKDIAKDDWETSMVIRGGNVASASQYMRRLDIDSATASYDPPGSMMRGVQRTAQSLAVAQGWANMMHVWNRFIRSSFGIDFARQIGQDVQKYDSLSPSMRAFYAKHGIGRTEALEMADMFRKHSRTVRNIQLPDTDAWAKAGRDDLVRRYRDAIIGAGDEAMLDPGIGDRPFMRRTALGRLVLQFQSFMYKAGNEWFAPMIQNFMLHPTDVRNYTSALLALMLGAASEEIRMFARGEESPIGNADNPEEWWRVVSNGFQRSPAMIGMTGAAVDSLVTPLAPTLNAAVGAPVFSEQYTRFRQNQGIAGLLAGPVGGMANTLFNAGVDFAEGDYDKVQDTAWKRAPILNTLPLWMLAALVNKVGE